MSNRKSYHFLANAATVLLVLLLAITMAVSPTHASKRCAHPDGTQKGKACKAGYECVNTYAFGWHPRCEKLSDGCKKQCRSGYVCVVESIKHGNSMRGCMKLAITN